MPSTYVRASFSMALLHPRYWLTWLWLLLLCLVAQLPFRLQLFLGRLLGRLLFHLMRKRRYVTERNLALCFPEKTQEERSALARQHFETNGMALFETGMAWFMPYWRLHKRFHLKGQEHWQTLQQHEQGEHKNRKGKSKGALIIAVHFNTLEITNVAINRLFDMCMSYRPHNNPVYDFIQRYGRERHNQHSSAINRNDVRAMVKAMKNGKWLWYAADQDYGPKVSAFVPWFGIEAAMVAAPPRLATMADVPVVALTYRRLSDYSGYEIFFHPAFDDFPSADVAADLIRLNQHYETAIRENIAEYLWVHRRFKTRPQGETSLYTI